MLSQSRKSARRHLSGIASLLTMASDAEVKRSVLFRLWLEYELAANATPFSLGEVCLRCLLAKLSIWHHASFATARLRHRQCFSQRRRGVWGIVYDVSDADLIVMDGFEDGYRREFLSVSPANNGGSSITALVYVAEIETNVPLPNAEYKRVIVEGAKHWQLPAPYLAMLEGIKAGQ